jgi:hypothetical protein
MANAYHHAVSSSRKWGGKPTEYLALHQWFDASKEHYADFRHRALRHHSQGIYEAERVFGETLTLSTGRQVPTRWVGEQHVQEDLGFIPTVADWLKHIKAEPWMRRGAPADLQAIAREEGPEAES